MRIAYVTNTPSPELHGEGWVALALRRCLRQLRALADLDVVPAPQSQRELAGHGVQARVQVQAQVPGVDTRLFTPARRDARLRQWWRADDAHRVLLHVGRLDAGANAELALQTFERLSARRPGLRLVVVGEGPLRARLARAHPSARFVGEQSGLALARHYASADVLLMPGLQDDGDGLLLEALASGLAVAAFHTASAGRHVQDGVSGCLAPPCRGLDMADALLAAATRALDAATPGGPMRSQARLAAERALGVAVAHTVAA